MNQERYNFSSFHYEKSLEVTVQIVFIISKYLCLEMEHDSTNKRSHD
jgi:hypothetical protein